MIDSDLSCIEESRRDAVRGNSLFGLDYVEVSADQMTLTVFFLGKAPAGIKKENVSITGGSRIKGIQVTGITLQRQKDSSLDDSMDVRVNQPGDFSTYTLNAVAIDRYSKPTGQPMAGFDPRYSEVDFNFKGACPTGLDCLPQKVCPPTQYAQPAINYLAKDYDSFRQLILDRLSLIMPSWQETHEPDIGVALVELLAYTGDYLSYYQDAVATEAYLGTARQRISVRRHVRLIDYAMHEGCNARAWVTLKSATDEQLPLSEVYFITGFPGAPGGQVLNSLALSNVPVSSYEVFQPLLPSTGTLSIYAAHSEIYFYTWGDDRCCLAPDATSATLVDSWIEAPAAQGAKKESAEETAPAKTRLLQLKVGDFLIFEEVFGPKTGNAADADPSHRQVVRLTSVTAAVDALYDQPIVEIQWSAEDALTFPMCLSAQLPAPNCTMLENISVARGNVLLVDHGANTTQALGTVPTDSTTANCQSPCHPALSQVTAGPFHPTLGQMPLTFSQLIPAGSCSASVLISQDPRQALPNISLASIPPAPAAPTTDSTCIPPLFTFADLSDPSSLALRLKQPGDIATQYLNAQLSPATRKLLAKWKGANPVPPPLITAITADLNAQLASWLPVTDLLESGGTDLSFVAEMDNDGQGHIRFGDGRLGQQPDAGMAFQASYRVGNGTAGNVGAGAIQYLVLRGETLSGSGIEPRNPMPATGGTAHEPISEVKLFAPHAFQDVLERAITANDYATLAADNSRRQEERSPRSTCTSPFVSLQGAKATLRWTGGWYEALVAIDPMNTDQVPAGLLSEVRTYLEPYRRMGHDLTVASAIYVPLDLALSVCVLPDYLRAHVEEDLLQVLGNGVQANGETGLFNPNNLSFGEGIYVSKIVAAAQAVTGVASVEVTRLARYQVGIKDSPVPPLGVLTLGPFEIAQLDNDPNFPERGRLEFKLRGGR